MIYDMVNLFKTDIKTETKHDQQKTNKQKEMIIIIIIIIIKMKGYHKIL